MPKTQDARKRKRIRTLVIDRATWLRGGKVNTCLLSADGHQCCLGFLATACGYKNKEISAMPHPEDAWTVGVPNLFPRWIVGDDRRDTEEACELMSINDVRMPESTREKRLITAFGNHGIKVTFK